MPLDITDGFPLEPIALASAIDIPLDQWPLACHGIACAVRDLVPVKGMRLVRGHYTGPVSHKSLYRGGLQQHSWLELADGRILDPTRWAMECPEAPYIYLGLCDHYDDGGRVLSARIPPMLPGHSGPDLSGPLSRLSPDEILSLSRSLGYSEGALDHLCAIVPRDIKLDPSQIPDPRTAYGYLEQIGLKALIPIDSWDRVMRPEVLACRVNANRYFSPPKQEKPDARGLISELLRFFVSVEERGCELECELSQYDISLDEYYDALNHMIDALDWPLKYFSSTDQYILGVVISDILGQGFGNQLRVERYAKSMGYDRADLDKALQQVGKVFGMDLAWA